MKTPIGYEVIITDDHAKLVVPYKGGEVVATIDTEDLPKVREMFSSLKKRKGTTHEYISGALRNGKGKQAYLHRIIMDAKKGEIVDHINGDTFDNRKSNLRIVTSQVNALNKGVSQRSTTGVAGVYPKSKNARGKPFVVRIEVNGRNRHFGAFNTIEEAKERAEQVREQIINELIN